MQTEDQKAVVDFLADPAAHGGAEPVERIDTHASIVFLAGDRAVKLKRAVRYPYLDFSTAEIRRAMCEREVAINRRTAPSLYLDAVPVTREPDGALALDGKGEAIDWVVVMRRFDQATLFDRMAEAGELDAARMRALAREIAAFHDAAEPRPGTDFAGNLRRAVASTRRSFADDAPAGAFPGGATDRVCDATLDALERIAPLLDDRRRAGRVRHCHGDLHLRNICLVGGAPTLFDAIEFDEALADIDVLYDLAFLLMDLEHRGLRPLGNTVLNAYLEARQDYAGLAALPLFLSFRATIRALVTATAAGMSDEPEPELAEARAYLDLAETLLTPPPARVVAVGGLPGSGKTTIARAVAPGIGAAPGAVVLRSDVIRKELAGVAPTERLAQSHYTRENTRRVYATLAARAEAVAAAGHAAVADAVFGAPDQRRALADAARRAGAALTGLWLQAPVDLRAARADARGADASDATAAFIRRSGRKDPAPRDWTAVDAAGSVSDVVERARAAATGANPRRD